MVHALIIIVNINYFTKIISFNLFIISKIRTMKIYISCAWFSIKCQKQTWNNISDLNNTFKRIPSVNLFRLFSFSVSATEIIKRPLLWEMDAKGIGVISAYQFFNETSEANFFSKLLKTPGMSRTLITRFRETRPEIGRSRSAIAEIEHEEHFELSGQRNSLKENYLLSLSVLSLKCWLICCFTHLLHFSNDNNCMRFGIYNS